MSRATAGTDVLPRWTKRVVTESTGRDPLGLSRVSQMITDFVLTGIITTTYRARYYSFYVWSLWHVHSEESPTKYDQFVESFQRREAAVALSSLIDDPDGSIVGLRQAGPRLRKGRSEGEISLQFPVLPSDPLGGYGQNYSGSLYQMGLTHRPNAYDEITTGFAERLAETVHKAFVRTPFIKKSLFRQRQISYVDLENSADRLSLTAIRAASAEAERRMLIDLFFGFDGPLGGVRTLYRRASLARILHVVIAYNAINAAVRSNTLELQLVYGPAYYNVLLGADGKAQRPYKTPAQLIAVNDYWKHFCAHEYLTQAIELLFVAVLELADSSPMGLKLDEILDRLMSDEFGKFFKENAGRPQDPKALLTRLGVAHVPDPEDSESFQRAFGAKAMLNEKSLLDKVVESPAAKAALSVFLLSILYAKWRGIRRGYALEDISQKARDELWIGNVLPMLDSVFNEKTSWRDFLRRQVVTLVLQQHDRIMYQKGRLDSCWLHETDGRIVKEQDYSNDWRSSRHWNGVSILIDLGLLEWKDQTLHAMPTAKEILARVLEADHA